MALSLGLLLVAYALGVLTVPALVAAGVFLFWLTAPDAERAPAKAAARPGQLAADAQGGRAPALPYSGRRAGWLHITRSLGKPPDAFGGQVKLADMVTRGLTNLIQGKRPDAAAADSAQEVYYVVLDGDTLVMYDGEAMSECRGVIIMSKHRVSLHHHEGVTESQVYSRRTPIRLSPVTDAVERGLCRGQVAEYYIYADRPTDKEDWYFALLWSSLEYASLDNSDSESPASLARTDTSSAAPKPDGDGGALGARSPPTGKQAVPLAGAAREQARLRMRRSCMVPDRAGIDAILQTVARRGSLHTAGLVCEDEWLNAIVGRIFIGTYRTEWARQHFIRKMQTKFDRVKRPAFLDRVVVADLDVGDNVPLITNPKLEVFDANGQVDLSMYMHYTGGFRLVLDTAVKLGSLRLTISLAVVLQNVTGKMLLRFKPAPSNRFWLAFYEMPTIGLSVSPVFMQKQVKYAAVSQAIEKQVYDMVRLSLVLPHMDDTVFFPTSFDDGGILEQALKDFRDAGLDKECTPNGGTPASNTQSDAVSSSGSSTRTRASDQILAGAGLDRATTSECSAASRRDTATPVTLSDCSTSSSVGLLIGSTAVPRGSPTPLAAQPTAANSTFSEAAASWFKRAKGSQAAESAKTWWQSLQQNGITGDAANSSQQQLPLAPATAPSTATAATAPGPKEARAGTHTTSTDESAESDSHSPSRQRRSSQTRASPVAVTAGRENRSSNAVQMVRLDGGSSSSVFSGQSAATDSLLVRRRPAAQPADSDVQLPARRQSVRPSNSPQTPVH
ncbi:hypothetical protein H4R21_004589 [Coemansia helicoidea]|uniref:Uncharacterized protein n=2 Tax=Coemansia TaxID=4863 RepID=A0ACC1KXB6_9FUNG|nr:hypothetical protein H4R21_004589 [Coemansia helicoidea]